jgi:hypothetical protein
MKTYKKYAGNKRYIEGSIAEKYIVEESTLYCMEYMPNPNEGNHKYTHEYFLDEIDECADEEPLVKGKKVNLTPVQFEQARKWVLQQSDELDNWQK